MSSARESVFTISVPITVGTSGHSIGDNVGGKQTVTSTVLASALSIGRRAVLTNIQVISNGVVTPPLDVYIFNSEPTVGNDDAAFDPSDTDFPRRVVRVTAWEINNDNAQGTSATVRIPVNPANDTNFYAAAVARGAATFAAANDLTFVYTIELED